MRLGPGLDTDRDNSYYGLAKRIWLAEPKQRFRFLSQVLRKIPQPGLPTLEPPLRFRGCRRITRTRRASGKGTLYFPRHKGQAHFDSGGEMEYTPPVVNRSAAPCGPEV